MVVRFNFQDAKQTFVVIREGDGEASLSFLGSMTSNLPASEPPFNGSPASDSPRPRQVLKAGGGGASLNFHEIWLYRDLLWALSSREIKLRYRQTALGAIWVIIQPIMSAGILSFVFNGVAGLKTGDVPPFLFTYAGTLIWTVFNTTLSKASSVLVGNASLISKVYFPRLCLPLSVVPPVLLDLGVSLVMLTALLIKFGILPTIAVFLWPLVLLITLMMALGIALVAASLMVSYRDVQYIIPVALNLLFFASPVAYATSEVAKKVPAWAVGIYNLNPLVGLLEASRFCLIGQGEVNAGALAYSTIGAVIVFAIGMKCFKAMERKFADVI
ncbi:ABC transporter permease [bacterium]|nr:MAG: ABC transporter permease [bacterium]